MPPRADTLPAGIQKLTTLLAHLNATPKLSLPGAKRLRLSLAVRNDHFGARHFVKEDLPRIRWANPTLEIEVRREQKTAGEEWRAEMEVELENGTQKTLSMQDKLSTNIVRELMDLAGGEPWKRHVGESAKAGVDVLPAPVLSSSPGKSKAKDNGKAQEMPNLEEYLRLHPHKRVAPGEQGKTAKAKQAKSVKASTPAPSKPKSTLPPPPNRSESSAALPF